VLPAPCYVVSDLHLGAHTAGLESRFRGFLRALDGRAGSLLIAGDLFDFWFEWRTVVPRPAYRVLAALADLRDRGLPILWIAGNHDCWGGDVLQRDVGVQYHVGPWTGEIAGWRVRVEHGDGLRAREDRRYRALRTVLRHPLSIALFRRLHPDFATRVATGSSEASRTHRALDGGSGLRAVAFRQLNDEPSLDAVIYGHSHVPSLDRAPGGGVYANAGSWLDQPTFLRIDAERAVLARWTESAEEESLHVLDRPPEKALG